MAPKLRALLAKARVRTEGPWGKLREPRQGICAHYDASASDLGAVSWLLFDPACTVSYNDLILDDGTVVTVAPENARAWHLGNGRPSHRLMRYVDGNSALYGIAIAARDGESATWEQERAFAALVRRRCARHRWDLAREPWRLTDHAAEAWPRGRKVDVRGTGATPVLPLERVRAIALQAAVGAA
jgi:N-acetyl-anhydromuramyl-L-alanine amidase AmpD